MSETEKNDTFSLPKIDTKTAWIYGSLGFPIAMLGPLGPYIPRLYASEMGISLALIGLVIASAAIFDAITDPVMGHFSDRWHSRWGRRRQWIVIGVPLWLCAVWMLLNPTEGVTIVYLAAFFLMLRAASTVLTLPYNAWGLELSSNYHSRTMIQSVREKYVLGGLVTSALIIAFSEEIFGRSEASFVMHNFSFAMLILVPLCALLVVTCVPEVPTIKAPPTSFKDGLSRMYSNKLFFRLLMIELLIAGGENFRNTLSLLFLQDYVGLPNVGRALILYFGSGLLAIPAWDWIAKRFGKHFSLASAMVLVGIVSLSVLTVKEGQLTKFYILFAMKGFCFGAFAYLPRAMLADVVDLDTIRTGSARPASYYAILGFVTKCAASFGGLSLPILAYIGYSTDPAIENTARELVWLGALYGVVPTVVFVVAFYLCITWPLNASMHARIERILGKKYQRLARRRGESPSEEG